MTTTSTPSVHQLEAMKLYEIADVIAHDWGSKVYFGAQPYLDAMSTIASTEDMYGLDSGDSIVRYFMANAATWRGETARAVKAELKRRCPY